MMVAWFFIFLVGFGLWYLFGKGPTHDAFVKAQQQSRNPTHGTRIVTIPYHSYRSDAFNNAKINTKIAAMERQGWRYVRHQRDGIKWSITFTR